MTTQAVHLNQLPKEWTHTTVASVGQVVTGTTPSKACSEYYGDDYPFFKPTDLNYGYCVKTARDGLSKLGGDQARLLPEKTIMVTCIGATIGKTGLTRSNGACNQQINAIVVNKGISPEFIYFMCISPQFQKSIIQNASATTLPIINKSKFEKLPIPLAPFREQVRIVTRIEELFSFIDAGTESLRKIQAQLKRYRQAVLKYAFEGKLTEKWRKINKEKIELGQELREKIEQARKTIPNKHSEKSIIEAIIRKLPALPEDWMWISVEDCCDVISGYAFKSKDFTKSAEISVIKIGNIGYSEFLWQDQEYLPKIFSETFSNYRIPSETILMALTRPITNDTLKVCTYPKDAKAGLLNQRVVMVNPFSFITKKILFFFMQSPIFKTQVTNGMSQTLQPNLSPKMLEQFQIPFFSAYEQEKIVAEIETRFSVADKISETIEQSLQQSEIMRQSVLRDAFAGKLVPHAPSDEPAEVLLQRIKSQKNVKYENNLKGLISYVK